MKYFIFIVFMVLSFVIGTFLYDQLYVKGSVLCDADNCECTSPVALNLCMGKKIPITRRSILS